MMPRAHTRRVRDSWRAQLQFYQGKDLKINFRTPIAKGNYGSVFFGSLPDGTQVVVKCPVLDEFSLKLFDTERAVNIKLSQQAGEVSVPWCKMVGEVNIPEPVPIAGDLARIGIVWEKEGTGITLEEYFAKGNDLYGVLSCQESPVQSKNGLLRPELARNVLGQMLIAVLQMQEKGIMHRDVKPSNTLVVPNDPQHQLKIIDFGSRHARTHARTHARIFSLSLSPPSFPLPLPPPLCRSLAFPPSQPVPLPPPYASAATGATLANAASETPRNFNPKP